MKDQENYVKEYILQEFLSGENPDELTDSTPLITGGILDSMAIMKLIAFLEERFRIELQAYETGLDYLNTISDIGKLVESKLLR
jgi:acyl carrier protein